MNNINTQNIDKQLKPLSKIMSFHLNVFYNSA